MTNTSPIPVRTTTITCDRLIEEYGEIRGEALWKKVVGKRGNARNRGIIFNIGMEDVALLQEKWLGHGDCDYSGLPLSGISGDLMQSSLERINDKKGYVRGNLCIVGVRVNQLKDNLIDKCTPTTLSEENLRLVKHMMGHMTEAHLESLKKKYNPETYKKESKVEEQSEVKQEVVKPTPAVKPSKLPEDAILAGAYVELCKFAALRGVTVTLTYSQFKVSYKTKRCFITGQELGDDRAPIMLDPKGPLDSKNLRFGMPLAVKAMNDLLYITKMTAVELAKNLRKLA